MIIPKDMSKVTWLWIASSWDLTLKSKARCLQSPTERLPIGTTTLKHSFRPLMHSFHMGTNSSSPMITGPLKEVRITDYRQHDKSEEEIKLLLQKDCASTNPIRLQISFAS